MLARVRVSLLPSLLIGIDDDDDDVMDDIMETENNFHGNLGISQNQHGPTTDNNLSRSKREKLKIYMFITGLSIGTFEC